MLFCGFHRALGTRLHASALTSKLIINDGFYFVEYENLKNPINVKIGDGRILKGTQVGQTLTYFVLNKMRIKISMSNVLFISLLLLSPCLSALDELSVLYFLYTRGDVIARKRINESRKFPLRY